MADVERQRTEWRRALLSPLWESPTAFKTPPRPKPGHHWPWVETRRLALETTSITSPEAVERRVLQFMNPFPGSGADESTVKNLAAAVQILLPGEAARPHRHSMNALRFVLEGSGAVTIVDGKSCPMEAGDLILTPAWCWHEHHHGGDQPILWLDALDVPLHDYLGTFEFQPGPVVDPPATVPDEAFSSPNFLPLETGPVTDHSPVYRYPYVDAAAAVARAAPSVDGARWVRYVNPLTGGAPMSSMDVRLMQIEPGSETISYRSNSNAICLVLEGDGVTSVEDETYTWKRNDLFTVPQDNWVSHRAGASLARLLVVSDREILSRLGLFREEYAEHG